MKSHNRIASEATFPSGPTTMVPRTGSMTSSTTNAERPIWTMSAKERCLHRLGCIGMIINPDSKTKSGRVIQMTEILFFALIALAGILVQVYTDSETSQFRQSRIDYIQVSLKLSNFYFVNTINFGHL